MLDMADGMLSGHMAGQRAFGVADAILKQLLPPGLNKTNKRSPVVIEGVCRTERLAPMSILNNALSGALASQLALSSPARTSPTCRPRAIRARPRC
jgi:Rod binding domain-containing protein